VVGVIDPENKHPETYLEFVEIILTFIYQFCLFHYDNDKRFQDIGIFQICLDANNYQL